jgi:hypothetical protein
MRNKWLLAGIVLAVSGFSHAGQTDKSLFNCVNLSQYSVDSQCTAALISEGKQYKAMQQKISVELAEVNPNAFATVQFNPEKMTIKVIAQREEATKDLFVIR